MKASTRWIIILVVIAVAILIAWLLWSRREQPAPVKSEGMRVASVQRYKGLGEKKAEQLWEPTMNP